MAGLVVKEEIGLELAQELALREAAEEHGFIDTNVPVHQGADRALMRRRAAGGDQCSANAHLALHILLQPVQRGQQWFERAIGQRPGGMFDLMALERIQPLGLEDPLGLIGEQHGIAVEGNAHFIGVAVLRLGRFGQHPRGRKAQLQRLLHIGGIGRQEQMRAQRLEVAERVAPLGEHPALDRMQPMGLAAAEHPHAAHRVIARQQHHLDLLHRAAVEGQQLAHQGECHPRRRRNIQPLQLQPGIGLVLVLLENPVFFFKVEQRPRRDRDHQLVVESGSHGRPCC